MDHIQQFEFKCEQGKKPEFIKQVFNVCEMTQTIIFVNTKSYSDTLHRMMVREGYKSTIITGNMQADEREA